MRKFNPYRNIFYYYRGQNFSIGQVEKQIEDNTTKALINTFELSNKSLLHTFLQQLKLPYTNPDLPQYDLQVCGEMSKPDALISIGKAKFYIESKVQALLDVDQIARHLETIEGSDLIVITPEDSDSSKLFMIDHKIRFITWRGIYILFMEYLDEHTKDSNLVLRQFLKYLESINMAPFAGFQKEDFDSFLFIEDDPKREIRSIVKKKFSGYLEELYQMVNQRKGYKDLKVEVGNLHKGSKGIWGTLSDASKDKVQVPHYNFILTRNQFLIGVIVEGKNPVANFIEKINNRPQELFEILSQLIGFSLDIKKRIYIQPRRFRNDIVVSLKCGEDISIDDIWYILNKHRQYHLLLYQFYFEIQRDDPALNTKEFINTSIKYMDMLRPLYEFAYDNKIKEKI